MIASAGFFLACGGIAVLDPDAGSASDGARPSACPGTPERCLFGCSASAPLSEQECHAGKWQCAPGSSLFSLCPTGTCLVSTSQCCDPTTGAGAVPTCDATGRIEGCPVGIEKLPLDLECSKAP
jgi:hypothetical protein